MTQKKSNKVLYLFLVFVLIGIPVLNYLTLKVCNTSLSPDTMLFYSANDLKELASIYGAKGAQFYLLSRVTFDLAFPFVYMALLFQLLNSLSFKNIVPMLKKVVIAVVFFDFLENINVSIVLMMMPNTPQFMFYFALVSSWSKWILLFFVVFVIILLIIYRRIKYANSHPI